MKGSYLKVSLHISPATNLTMRLQRLIPSAAISRMAVDSHDTPMAATFLSLRSAASLRARGVEQYVYREPAAVSSSSGVVAT